MFVPVRLRARLAVVRSGSIGFSRGLGHVFALLCLAVPLSPGTMVNLARGVHPDLPRGTCRRSRDMRLRCRIGGCDTGRRGGRLRRRCRGGRWASRRRRARERLYPTVTSACAASLRATEVCAVLACRCDGCLRLRLCHDGRGKTGPDYESQKKSLHVINLQLRADLAALSLPIRAADSTVSRRVRSAAVSRGLRGWRPA